MIVTPSRSSVTPGEKLAVHQIEADLLAWIEKAPWEITPGFRERPSGRKGRLVGHIT